MRQKANLILIPLIFVVSCTQRNNIDHDRITDYVKYIDQIDISAKEYILNKFHDHDIVILAERYHTEETQYELINDIICDDYFISNVGNICIEIGSSNYSESLNSFLNTFNGNLTEGQYQLLKYQRNISFYPIWNRDSYRLFLANILKLNSTLDQPHKINLYLCDREFDWSKIKTRKDWKEAINNNRDSIIAENITRQYDRILSSSKNKLLIILNEAHAITNTSWIDCWQKRAAQYLSKKYGNKKIASVLINSVKTDKRDKDILIQDGYWDAAFSISNKTDIGFDFKNSPFGEDYFDYASGKNNDQFRYKNIFTGFVFYKPLTQHKLSTGVNGIIDSDFYNEFLRRIKIYKGKIYYQKLKGDQELLGWNKIEYYHYDDFSKMHNKIKKIEEEYFKIMK